MNDDDDDDGYEEDVNPIVSHFTTLPPSLVQLLLGVLMIGDGSN